VNGVGTGRTVLIVPGWNGSEHDHWQSVWERKNPNFVRVQQSDWRQATRSDWVRGLGRAIDAIEQPVVLVAHSLGCLAVAAWAAQAPGAAKRVDCALLVAPPDLERQAPAIEPLREFGSPSRQPLPFRSLLVASEDDPYMSLDSAETLAEDWRCKFENAGLVGHINCASGFGDWVEGERLLVGLLNGNAVVQRAITAPA